MKYPRDEPFNPKDENGENLKIHVNYAGNLHTKLAERKQVIQLTNVFRM